MIVFSVFGITYVRSLQQRFVAMISDQPVQSSAEQEDPRSPFASIGGAFKSLQANISSLISGDVGDDSSVPPTMPVPVPPQRLP